MKLLGFMKNGKGTVHETGELSPATGSIDTIKKLDNGVTIVEIHLGSPQEALWRNRKPKQQQPDESAEFSE